MNPLEERIARAKQAGFTDEQIQSSLSRQGLVQSQGQQPTQPRQPGWAERNASTVGSIALPTIGAFSTGGATIPASAALAGAGYAGGQGVSNVLKTIRETQNQGGIQALIKALQEDPNALSTIGSQLLEAPQRFQNETTKAQLGGGATAGMNLLLGNLLGAIAKPLFGKTGKVKLGTPGQIAESAKEQMNTVYGPKIGEIINQIKDKSIDVTDIVDRLNSIRKEAVLSGDKAAVRAVDAVIDRVMPKNKPTYIAHGNAAKNIEEAFATKKAFGKDILKPTGEIRISTGNKGSVTKLAKTISGDEMQKLIIEEAKRAGIKDAPKIFERYAALAKLANQMKTKPFGGYQAGYLIPLILGGLIGNNPALTAAGAATGAVAMPYTRTLIPQILGRLIEGLKLPITAAGSNQINKLQNKL